MSRWPRPGPAWPGVDSPAPSDCRATGPDGQDAEYPLAAEAEAYKGPWVGWLFQVMAPWTVFWTPYRSTWEAVQEADQVSYSESEAENTCLLAMAVRSKPM